MIKAAEPVGGQAGATVVPAAGGPTVLRILLGAQLRQFDDRPVAQLAAPVIVPSQPLGARKARRERLISGLEDDERWRLDVGEGIQVRFSPATEGKPAVVVRYRLLGIVEIEGPIHANDRSPVPPYDDHSIGQRFAGGRIHDLSITLLIGALMESLSSTNRMR